VVSFLHVLRQKQRLCFSSVPSVLHAPPISSYSDYPNNFWWTIQITKLLIVQFSSTSRDFSLSQVQHFLQHCFIRHPQSREVRYQVSYPYKTVHKIAVLCILILKFLYIRQYILNWRVASIPRI
jgi:hypothetical protein